MKLLTDTMVQVLRDDRESVLTQLITTSVMEQTPSPTMRFDQARHGISDEEVTKAVAQHANRVALINLLILANSPDTPDNNSARLRALEIVSLRIKELANPEQLEEIKSELDILSQLHAPAPHSYADYAGSYAPDPELPAERN